MTFGYLFLFELGREGVWGGGGGVTAAAPSSLTQMCVFERPRCNMDKNGGEKDKKGLEKYKCLIILKNKEILN